LGIQRVFQARDGVIGETLLTRKFVERAGCADVDDLFHRLYRRQLTYDDLQPMAKLVFDAAFEGDRTSCDILESGGMYLGKMVNATARKLRMNDIPFEVVMAGSVFKGRSSVLIDALQSEIRRECPSARPVMPLFEPVVGALLMGMEVNGGVSADVYDNLSSRLLDAERRYNVRFRTE
jgi:N-acetylglucosamine kinase-like BadF-type ATPase